MGYGFETATEAIDRGDCAAWWPRRPPPTAKDVDERGQDAPSGRSHAQGQRIVDSAVHRRAIRTGGIRARGRIRDAEAVRTGLGVTKALSDHPVLARWSKSFKAPLTARRRGRPVDSIVLPSFDPPTEKTDSQILFSFRRDLCVEIGAPRSVRKPVGRLAGPRERCDSPEDGDAANGTQDRSRGAEFRRRSDTGGLDADRRVSAIAGVTLGRLLVDRASPKYAKARRTLRDSAAARITRRQRHGTVQHGWHPALVGALRPAILQWWRLVPGLPWRLRRHHVGQAGRGADPATSPTTR